ncbi:MAG TPA: hypothetical protein VKF42_09530, partial [Chitinivibrionales bacterium]|nr:hypothetical protein [Chitinivibrionales bacterium]
SWLHPRVVRCILDIRKGAPEVFAFGLRVSTPKKIDGTGQGAAAEEEKKNAAAVSVESAAAAHGREPGPQHSNKETAAPEKSSAEPRGKKTAPWIVRAKRVKQLWVFAGDASFRGKVLRWVLRTLRLLLRTCSIARVRVAAKAGFDDPAKTGLLYGWYTGATRMLSAPGPRRVELRCEPVFTEATFEANAEAKLATSVARLLVPLVAAMSTFPYLHAYVLYRRARRVE